MKTAPITVNDIDFRTLSKAVRYLDNVCAITSKDRAHHTLLCLKADDSRKRITKRDLAFANEMISLYRAYTA